VKRADIIERLRNQKATLAEQFGVASLSLFGSASRDEMRPDSDIDILVTYDGPPTFDRYFGLKIYLEDLLGYPVDLATDEMLKPRLRRNIAPEIVNVT
jgi:hypothetical protein